MIAFLKIQNHSMQGGKIRSIHYRQGIGEYEKKSKNEKIRCTKNVDWEQEIKENERKREPRGAQKNQVSSKRWAKELIVALPNKGLKDDQIDRLLSQYLGAVTARYNCSGDWFYHEKKDNKHAHFMLTTRDKETKKKIKTMSSLSPDFEQFAKKMWEVTLEQHVEKAPKFETQKRSKFRSVPIGIAKMLKRERKKVWTKEFYQEFFEKKKAEKIKKAEIKKQLIAALEAKKRAEEAQRLENERRVQQAQKDALEARQRALNAQKRQPEREKKQIDTSKIDLNRYDPQSGLKRSEWLALRKKDKEKGLSL